jgi:transposase-like protein
MFPIQACVNKPKLTLFRSTYLNTMIMLPPKKRAKIIAALKTNPNASAVARQVGGVSLTTVWRVAKQTGINLVGTKAARSSLPPETRARIIAALKANPNASAVARQVGGVGKVTVWKIAKQTGIDLPAAKAARRSLPPETRARIIAALKTNPNAEAVARQVGGVSRTTVWKIAKWEDIELTAGKAARAHYGTRQKAPAPPNHARKC